VSSAKAPTAALLKLRPLVAEIAPDVELADEALELALSVVEAAEDDAELLLAVALAEELDSEDSEAVDEAALEAVEEAWEALLDSAEPLLVVEAGAATAKSCQRTSHICIAAQVGLTSTSDILHESESAGTQSRLPTSQVRSTAIGARSGRQDSSVACESWVDITRHSAARRGQKRVGRARRVEGARARQGTALGKGAGGGHDLRVIASSHVVV
jgi:hypothetical protein